MVGLPIMSYQCSTGTWPVTMVDRFSYRSSTISKRSRRCSSLSFSGPQSSRISRLVLARASRSSDIDHRCVRVRGWRTACGDAMVGDREILAACLVP